jgi:hypothetical protein
MHRFGNKIKSFVRRLIMPKLCSDCKPKIARMVGVKVSHSHRKKHRKGKKLHGAAKAAFLRRMAAGRRKHRR